MVWFSYKAVLHQTECGVARPSVPTTLKKPPCGFDGLLGLCGADLRPRPLVTHNAGFGTITKGLQL